MRNQSEGAEAFSSVHLPSWGVRESATFCDCVFYFLVILTLSGTDARGTPQLAST